MQGSLLCQQNYISTAYIYSHALPLSDTSVAALCSTSGAAASKPLAKKGAARGLQKGSQAADSEASASQRSQSTQASHQLPAREDTGLMDRIAGAASRRRLGHSAESPLHLFLILAVANTGGNKLLTPENPHSGWLASNQILLTS